MVEVHKTKWRKKHAGERHILLSGVSFCTVSK